MLDPNLPPLVAVLRNDEQIVSTIELQAGRYVIGRDPANEIAVDAPSLAEKHARLTVVGDEQFFIEDLDPAAGTYLDGTPVAGIAPMPLDASVQLGDLTLELQRAGMPAVAFRHLPAGFLRLSRYDFGEIIVQGSTSIIYAAHDTTVGREVALKVLLPESQADVAHVLRFVRDAQIAGQLQHSGILPIYDLSLDDRDQLFYTTRFVEGQALSTILEQLAAGDEATLHAWWLPALIVVFQKACDVIAYAHERGVVHGALRPEAITVGDHGEVFVTDWSFARNFATEEPLPTPPVTAPAAVNEPGLSAYSSPEQAEGAYEDIEPRTDVHALGGILYKIITLADPLAGGTDSELLEQTLSAKVVAPVELCGASPRPHWPGGRLAEGLCSVAMQALRLARHERQASVLELQSQIAAWQHGAVAGEGGRLWKQFTGLLHGHRPAGH